MQDLKELTENGRCNLTKTVLNEYVRQLKASSKPVKTDQVIVNVLDKVIKLNSDHKEPHHESLDAKKCVLSYAKMHPEIFNAKGALKKINELGFNIFSK